MNIREIELREQDRWLPIANVARLMKGTLPSTAKVSKEAKECMQECVSEFISFITSEASDKCLTEKRKTINGEDVLFAMTSLGFENYSEILKIYLAKYREQQALKQERGDNKRKPKSAYSESYANPEPQIDERYLQYQDADSRLNYHSYDPHLARDNDESIEEDVKQEGEGDIAEGLAFEDGSELLYQF